MGTLNIVFVETPVHNRFELATRDTMHENPYFDLAKKPVQEDVVELVPHNK